MDRKDLVTIFTVQNPMKAEIIRAALQSAGIPCEIGGESQAGFAGVLGIDVMTQVGDLERARTHLRKLRKSIRLRKKRRAEAKQAKADEALKLKDAIQELPKPTTEIQPPPETPME
jgi:hypothetical protein